VGVDVLLEPGEQRSTNSPPVGRASGCGEQRFSRSSRPQTRR
jgi:hypothetical protein